ncbi:MAG: hypothetical protein F2845_06165 [Actinobacteria bacterium]|nr:hypothetical protein [Actinomycetota bacterium]MSV64358.1 hypothetical protein [Actinomycetota bacterium]MSW26402.1 hypothetical protein [Actinomycetota bacterium]MSW34553.1 hypothetical protein [Actinomycetota bacterium]MSX31271.1 hypothetical protein [Actinomycetota bacterium]
MKEHLPDKQSRRSIVATLLSIEAAAVLALGTYLVVKALTSDLQSVTALLGVVLFALVGGVGLLAAARGFRNAKNYGRSPAILANLIALGVAYFQMQAHLWAVAIPLALISLLTALLALSIIPE